MISHLRSVRLPTAWHRNDILHHARRRRRGRRWKTAGKTGSEVVVSSRDRNPWVRSSARGRCAEHGHGTVAGRGNNRRLPASVRDGYRTLPSSSDGGTRRWSSASSPTVPVSFTLAGRGLSTLNTDDDGGRTLRDDADDESRKAELLRFFRRDVWNDVDRVLSVSSSERRTDGTRRRGDDCDDVRLRMDRNYGRAKADRDGVQGGTRAERRLERRRTRAAAHAVSFNSLSPAGVGNGNGNEHGDGHGNSSGNDGGTLIDFGSGGSDPFSSANNTANLNATAPTVEEDDTLVAMVDELFGKDHKAEAIHPGLDGNDNNEPSILPPPQYPPPSPTASSLLDLLSDEDSYYGTDMKTPPHANSNSLANSIEGRSTAAGGDAYLIKETGDGRRREGGGAAADLMDLLDKDYGDIDYFEDEDGDGGLSSSPIDGNIVVGAQAGATGGGGSVDIEEKKELSLLDLLSDDDIGSTNARKEVPSTSTTHYDTSTNSAAIEKKDSKPVEGSLMDLLDDDVIDFFRDDHEVNESLMDSGSRVGVGQSAEGAVDDETKTETMPSVPPLSDVLLRAKILHRTMSKRDWDTYKCDAQTAATAEDFETASVIDIAQADEGEILFTDDYDDDYDNKDEDEDEDETEETNEPSTLIFVKELLHGLDAHRWTLTTDEFNLLLHAVVVANTPTSSSSSTTPGGKIELLLSLWSRMRELEDAGITSSAPDSDTYTILMDTFDREGDSLTAVAAGICEVMLDRISSSSSPTGEEAGEFVLKEDAVRVGMRVLERRLDVDNGEQLLKSALGEEGKGVWVGTAAFKSMLNTYRADDRKDGALQLVEDCIRENGTARRGSLENFLLVAASWPQKGRDGMHIPVADYYRSLVALLDHPPHESFRPSYKVWRKLMVASSRAAKFEPSTENWSLVSRCCGSLLNHRDIKEDKDFVLDGAVVKIGLKTAEVMKDPQLAADILTYAEPHNESAGNIGAVSGVGGGRISLEDVEEVEKSLTWRPTVRPDDDQHDDPIRQQHLPPSLYFNAIQLCIKCKRMDLAYEILTRRAHGKGKFSELTLTELYTQIMTGYARVGDLESTESTFNEMKAKGLKYGDQAYAAYLHALASDGKHSEALSLLVSMSSNAAGDDVRPGRSSFAACMLSAIQTRSWSDVLDLNKRMVNSGIPPDAMSLQGVVIAHSHSNDRPAAIRAMEDAFSSSLPVNHDAFLTCARVLTTGIFLDNSIENSRGTLRNAVDAIDDKNGNGLPVSNVKKEKKEAMLALSRSLRLASVEDARRPSRAVDGDALRVRRERLWRGALGCVLRLARVED